MRNRTLFRFVAAVALTSTALSPISVGAAESMRTFAPTATTTTLDLAGPSYLDDDGQPKKKKGSGKTGKILACGAMILLGALLGGKKGLAIGIGACAVTWAIAGLTKKDNDALTDRGEQLLDEDGPQRATWRAPESGTELEIVTGAPTQQTAKIEFEVDDGVAAPEQGARLNSEPYVVVVDRLNFRSQPSAASDATIRGYFERGDVVQVIAVSANGQWAAVGDDGVIVGYASLTAGGADALVTINRANQLRRAPPPPPVRRGVKPRPAPAPSFAYNRKSTKAKPKIIMAAGSTMGTLRNADTQKTKSIKVANVTTTCKPALINQGSRAVANRQGCQRGDGKFVFT